MRRPLAIAAAAVVLSLVLGGSVRAGAAPSDWTVNSWDAGTVTTSDDSPGSFSVSVSHDDRRDVTGSVTATTSSTMKGCGGPTVSPSSSSSSAGTFSTTVTLSFPFTVDAECNGSYAVSVEMSVPENQINPADSYTLTSALSVARPAPALTSVTAAAQPDRSVVVGWTPASTPKDLLGFVITRSDGATFNITDPRWRSFTDTSIPSTGGTYTYSVASKRYQVASSPATSARTVSVGPTPTSAPPTTAAPVASDPAAQPGGGTTPAGGGTGTAPTGGGGVVVRGTPAPTNPGVSPRPTIPAGDADQGFETALPYEAETGGVAAELPSGSEASTELARAGLLVPFAVALLLAVWGVHIALVARSARDADDALALLTVELE